MTICGVCEHFAIDQNVILNMHKNKLFGIVFEAQHVLRESRLEFVDSDFELIFTIFS